MKVPFFNWTKSRIIKIVSKNVDTWYTGIGFKWYFKSNVMAIKSEVKRIKNHQKRMPFISFTTGLNPSINIVNTEIRPEIMFNASIELFDIKSLIRLV